MTHLLSNLPPPLTSHSFPSVTFGTYVEWKISTGRHSFSYRPVTHLLLRQLLPKSFVLSEPTQIFRVISVSNLFVLHWNSEKTFHSPYSTFWFPSPSVVSSLCHEGDVDVWSRSETDRTGHPVSFLLNSNGRLSYPSQHPLYSCPLYTFSETFWLEWSPVRDQNVLKFRRSCCGEKDKGKFKPPPS